ALSKTPRFLRLTGSILGAVIPNSLQPNLKLMSPCARTSKELLLQECQFMPSAGGLCTLRRKSVQVSPEKAHITMLQCRNPHTQWSGRFQGILSWGKQELSVITSEPLVRTVFSGEKATASR